MSQQYETIDTFNFIHHLEPTCHLRRFVIVIPHKTFHAVYRLPANLNVLVPHNIYTGFLIIFSMTICNLFLDQVAETCAYHSKNETTYPHACYR